MDDEDIDDLREPVESLEIKNGQWLGVTVRSQGIGGKVRDTLNASKLERVLPV